MTNVCRMLQTGFSKVLVIKKHVAYVDGLPNANFCVRHSWEGALKFRIAMVAVVLEWLGWKGRCAQVGS